MQVSFPITNKEVLLECIPQRSPIVMVDALISFEDHEVVSGFTVYAEGLFAKNETLTEPGLIEHMAQTVALHTGFGFYIKNQQAPTGYIGSISDLRVSRLPVQNETIITTATILHEFSGVTLVDIVSKVQGTVIASGRMKTVIAQ